MKKILFIATGGTIASKQTEDGLTPEIDFIELLSYIDDLSSFCTIDGIQLLNIDSTNINHNHWIKIASCIKDNYDRYDGFVITHGTDTMAYTAAALSYLIQNSKKPIVLTGSQKSIYMRDSDAKGNLENAFIYASNDKANNVTLVFDNKVILGTRAKKNRTKSFDAFTSINYPEIAHIIDKKVKYFIETSVEENVKFYLKMNPSVFVLKLIPGLNLNIFDFVAKNFDAVIVESFGVGGIPVYYEKEFADALEKIFIQNKTIVITTQVPYEGSNLGLYQVGKKIKEKYELLEGYDMTIEALVAKIMWIRGQTNSHKLVKKLLYTPINKDILI